MPGVRLALHERLDALDARGRGVGRVDRVLVDDHAQQLSEARAAHVGSRSSSRVAAGVAAGVVAGLAAGVAGPATPGSEPRMARCGVARCGVARCDVARWWRGAVGRGARLAHVWVVEGPPPSDHLVDEAAERPPVHARAVRPAGEELRSHVLGRADHAASRHRPGVRVDLAGVERPTLVRVRVRVRVRAGAGRVLGGCGSGAGLGWWRRWWRGWRP